MRKTLPKLVNDSVRRNNGGGHAILKEKKVGLSCIQLNSESKELLPVLRGRWELRLSMKMNR